MPTTKAARKSGSRKPKSPFPPQHQKKPGIESRMHPRPLFEARGYRGSGKLAGQSRADHRRRFRNRPGRRGALRAGGADVAIVYLRQEQSDADDTRMAVEAEGARCLLLPGDVRKSDFCAQAVDATVDGLGKLDILVNNAAFQQHQESIEDLTDDQFERTFATNIFGYFYMANAAVPHLKPGAPIVNTGSITGLEGNKKLLDYSATKGAIHAFTKSLAQNLVDRAIRVNCVAPGPIWTPLNRRPTSRRRRSRRMARTHRWDGPGSRKRSRRRTCSSRRTRIRATSPARS